MPNGFQLVFMTEELDLMIARLTTSEPEVVRLRQRLEAARTTIEEIAARIAALNARMTPTPP